LIISNGDRIRERNEEYIDSLRQESKLYGNMENPLDLPKDHLYWDVLEQEKKDELFLKGVNNKSVKNGDDVNQINNYIDEYNKNIKEKDQIGLQNAWANNNEPKLSIIDTIRKKVKEAFTFTNFFGKKSEPVPEIEQDKPNLYNTNEPYTRVFPPPSPPNIPFEFRTPSTAFLDHSDPEHLSNEALWDIMNTLALEKPYTKNEYRAIIPRWRQLQDIKQPRARYRDQHDNWEELYGKNYSHQPERELYPDGKLPTDPPDEYYDAVKANRERFGAKFDETDFD